MLHAAPSGACDWGLDVGWRDDTLRLFRQRRPTPEGQCNYGSYLHLPLYILPEFRNWIYSCHQLAETAASILSVQKFLLVFNSLLRWHTISWNKLTWCDCSSTLYNTNVYTSHYMYIHNPQICEHTDRKICVCVYMYLYIYKYININIHIHIYIYVCIHIHGHIHIHI